MLFNERLSSARAAAGYTQVEFAVKLGISKTLYNKYEKSKVRPSYEMIVQIAKALNVSLDYLFGMTDYPNMVVLEKLRTLPDEWFLILWDAINSNVSPTDLKNIISILKTKK
jgi:transcriptional regulator with XRE-family HTH domain